MNKDKRGASLGDHLDEKYGKVGTKSREEFQDEFSLLFKRFLETGR